MKFSFYIVLVFMSCTSEVDKVVDTSVVERELVDLDGDGYDSSEDCDDFSATTNPGAAELCDGIDNNCDGEIDEGVLNIFFQDSDGDGFGNTDVFEEACFAEDGFVSTGNDCDDRDANSYPSAPEQCDEVDNDCDGVVDEDLQTDWWLDEDGDGFGDPEFYAEGCLADEGFAANSDDCDDSDAEVNPDIEEICDEVDNNCDGEIDEDLTITVYVDADLDGYGDDSQWVDVCELIPGYATIGGDCDDIDSFAFPGGVEICDDVDNNCDGQIDEGVGSPGTVWYDDIDQDGFGDDSASQIGCTGDPGQVTTPGDCDDTDANNYPGNTEICDGQDNNCDNTVDDDDSLITGQPTFYEDLDSDGIGSSVSQLACLQPSGFVSATGDCNDLDNTVYPGAPEVCDLKDNTCDGLVDDNDPLIVGQTTFYQDLDSDGVGSNVTSTVCFVPSGYVSITGDCDDSNVAIYTGAAEICDGLDNDCDGATDDTDSDVIGQTTYYEDADTDGFGSGVSQTVCFQPNGYVTSTGDCNDGDISINPNAIEVCDTIDNDCDGDIDDSDSSIFGQTTYYEDSDSDGFGSSVSQTVCFEPTGYVTSTGDCNDTDSAINPNANEICDNIDNDCDGDTDDADSSISGQDTYYLDSDSDGFGDISVPAMSCNTINGYVSNDSDCDDGDATEYPGVTWYTDSDGDGYGNSSNFTTCSRNASTDVTAPGDCNDGDNAVNPNAVETCDNIDNDCDGATDDADSGVTGQSTFYQDSDADGFGSNVTISACFQPGGYVTNNSDCDDAFFAIKPGVQEVCDGVDNDCNGAIDDADSGVVGQGTYYRDLDSDGYGNNSNSTLSCSLPSGYTSNNTDCDDSSSSVNPAASESCNGVDDDCDGSTDENVQSTFYRDLDGDGYGNSSNTTISCSAPSGYTSNGSDCNDSSSSVYPGASESCNGVDDDCDGSTDEGVLTTYYRDVDGDGYGVSSNTTSSCSAPSGYSSVSNDCNDSSTSIYPGAPEQCNLTDNDCDGGIDEGASCRVLIQRYFSTSGGHFYTSNPVEAASLGYGPTSSSFYLYNTHVSGTSPFYRCLNTYWLGTFGQYRFFYTTSSTCENSGALVQQGVIGYIANSNISGTTTLWRLYNPASSDHLFTTGYQDRLNAEAGGYNYEGVPGYVWTSNN